MYFCVLYIQWNIFDKIMWIICADKKFEIIFRRFIKERLFYFYLIYNNFIIIVKLIDIFKIKYVISDHL